MTTPKLPHHMRIAALQCNFEGGEDNTLRIPELWEEFGFNTEQLFHPIGELYSAVFDLEKHGEILHRYIEKSSASGISIILYLNCHILLKSQKNMAEEWARKNADGSYTKLYETYLANCLNSSWMDYFFSLLNDLADYRITGIFFDGPVNTHCHCSKCSAKFNNDYGKAMEDATEKELDTFSLRTQINAKRIISEKVKNVNPDWISYFNEGLLHSKSSTEEMREVLQYNDIIGTEGGFQFGGPPKQVCLWRCGVSAKMTEAVADGKPTVIFMAGDHKPWSWYLHTPSETKLCYASALANGASIWYGIHCATSALHGAAGDAVRDMIQFDKKHSDLYLNTKSLAQVAILRSFDTAKNYTSTGEETDLYDSASRKAGGLGNYSESFDGAVATLFRSNIAFDIITELNINDIEKYSVVLAPTAACLNSSIINTLTRYVSNGGCLIADSEFGQYDENMTRLKSPAINKLTGINNIGYINYNPHDYFTFTDKGRFLASAGAEFIPAPLIAIETEIYPAANTKILAELCHPLAGRYAGKPEKGKLPFITENKYGKGHIYYIAGTFFELYKTYSIYHYKKLISDLIQRHASLDFELLQANEAVEFTVRKCESPNYVIAHLVNYTGGMSRPINAVTPLHGLYLKVPENIKSARSLVQNCELQIKDSIVTLPILNEFDVILLNN